MKNLLVDFEELKTLCFALLGSIGLGDLISWVTVGKVNKLYLFGSRLVICEVRETTGYCPRPLPKLWLEDFMESRAEDEVRVGGG